MTREAWNILPRDEKLRRLKIAIEAAKAAVDEPSFSRKFAGLRRQAARARLDRLVTMKAAVEQIVD